MKINKFQEEVASTTEAEESFEEVEVGRLCLLAFFSYLAINYDSLVRSSEFLLKLFLFFAFQLER